MLQCFITFSDIPAYSTDSDLLGESQLRNFSHLGSTWTPFLITVGKLAISLPFSADEQTLLHCEL
jgi:hypothetical protein